MRTYSNETSRARSPCIVISSVSIRLDLHNLPEVRRVDHQTATDVEAVGAE
jgi:hypothetical protein